jgi:hypothetical protein
MSLRASIRSAGPRLTALAACACLHLPAPAQPDGEPKADPAAAAVPGPTTESPAETSDGPTQVVEDILQTTRRTLRSTTEWVARTVDGSFGDKSFDQYGKVGAGRLDLIVHKRERQPYAIDQRFSARFRLPNFEHRVHVFIGNEDERDIVTDNPQAFTQQQRLRESRPVDRSFFAGVKMPFLEAFEFRVGVRGPFKPFAQASYDHAWALSDADTIAFRETLFWTLADRFGSTTVGSYAHTFSPTVAVRWLNSATITEVTRRLEWNSLVGAYKVLGVERLVALEALFSGAEGTGVPVSEYGLQVRWEQPLYRDWLLGEVGVGHFWPRPDAFSVRDRVWGLAAALKLKF